MTSDFATLTLKKRWRLTTTGNIFKMMELQRPPAKWVGVCLALETDESLSQSKKCVGLACWQKSEACHEHLGSM